MPPDPSRSVPLGRYAAIALGAFGWSPETFWTATPDDFWAALDSHHAGWAAPAPPARAELAALMVRFPD